MRVRRLSLDSWIVDDLGSVAPADLARSAQEKWPELEFCPAFSSVGVRGCDRDPASLLEGLKIVENSGRRREIPLCLELGLDEIQGVERLFEVELTVVALGFQPGFPYMSGLPESLVGHPRRSSPRPRLPAGSVGLALDMAGIYPAELPGGWNIIGRTPLTICDAATSFFPLAPGDRVAFERISVEEFEARQGDRLAD